MKVPGPGSYMVKEETFRNNNGKINPITSVDKSQLTSQFKSLSVASNMDNDSLKWKESTEAKID